MSCSKTDMPRPSEKKLGRLVAAKVPHLDPEMAEEYYRGLVKAIMGELRERGYVFLPGLGRINLVIRNPRRMKANRSYWHFKQSGYHDIPERRYVKLVPSQKMMAYVNDFMVLTKEAERRGRSVRQ